MSTGDTRGLSGDDIEDHDTKGVISGRHTTLLMHNDTFTPKEGGNLIRANRYDAGADIRASEDIILYPYIPIAVPTGLHTAIPIGMEGIIRGRSGLAFNHSVFCIHVGTIDSSFRGEVKVLLLNYNSSPYKINKGDHIAQMVVHKIVLGCFMEVDELPQPCDGRIGGFGSTDILNKELVK